MSEGLREEGAQLGQRRTVVEDVTVVDLFCGVGGLSHGFFLEGMNVAAGIDSDESCRYAYEKNNGARFLCADVGELRGDEVAALYPKDSIKVLVGCAPCQPYSPHTRKQRRKSESWTLLQNFAEIIERVRPDVISMENVPELRSFGGGNVYKDFMDRLADTYYTTDPVVYCPDYGVPQRRSRLVVLGSRFGPLNLADRTHAPGDYATVEEAIGHLPPIGAGERDPHDPMHRASGLSEVNLRRIRQSVPGGTWNDWDAELRANCHTKSSGETYPDVYGRMTWEEPSPTITTQANNYGSGRFGHPEQNRALSMREAALLQTFPQDYEFLGSDAGWSFKTLGRQVGNAVPVNLGRAIAKSVKEHLEEVRGPDG